ncbi:hypothetical protein [Actinophytocola sp.]|uniref:hypothetical protein n=1 Tax=Actinophytocola sp. TaxID=1872138 RepID=UPI003D6A60B0
MVDDRLGQTPLLAQLAEGGELDRRQFVVQELLTVVFGEGDVGQMVLADRLQRRRQLRLVGPSREVAQRPGDIGRSDAGTVTEHLTRKPDGELRKCHLGRLIRPLLKEAHDGVGRQPRRSRCLQDEEVEQCTSHRRRGVGTVQTEHTVRAGSQDTESLDVTPSLHRPEQHTPHALPTAGTGKVVHAQANLLVVPLLDCLREPLRTTAPFPIDPLSVELPVRPDQRPNSAVLDVLHGHILHHTATARIGAAWLVVRAAGLGEPDGLMRTVPLSYYALRCDDRQGSGGLEMGCAGGGKIR